MCRERKDPSVRTLRPPKSEGVREKSNPDFQKKTQSPQALIKMPLSRMTKASESASDGKVHNSKITWPKDSICEGMKGPHFMKCLVDS